MLVEYAFKSPLNVTEGSHYHILKLLHWGP
jgi:hypothetical protein